MKGFDAGRVAFLASGFVDDAGAILISTIDEGAAASEPFDGSVEAAGSAPRTGFPAGSSAEEGFICGGALRDASYYVAGWEAISVRRMFVVCEIDAMLITCATCFPNLLTVWEQNHFGPRTGVGILILCSQLCGAPDCTLYQQGVSTIDTLDRTVLASSSVRNNYPCCLAGNAARAS